MDKEDQMTPHQQLVHRLKKPGEQILQSLDPKKVDLFHQAMALMIEIGELCDPIKKHLIYGKELDIENLKEELGDIEFYLEAIRQNLGISRKETLECNIQKLNKRYPEGYTDQAAQERADKRDFVVTDSNGVHLFGPATLSGCLESQVDRRCYIQHLLDNRYKFVWSFIKNRWEEA